MTTKRNFYEELHYHTNMDMENGDDIKTICYPSLICIIAELCDRIEKLEDWKNRARSAAEGVRGGVKRLEERRGESENNIEQIKSDVKKLGERNTQYLEEFKRVYQEYLEKNGND